MAERVKGLDGAQAPPAEPRPKGGPHGFSLNSDSWRALPIFIRGDHTELHLSHLCTPPHAAWLGWRGAKVENGDHLNRKMGTTWIRDFAIFEKSLWPNYISYGPHQYRDLKSTVGSTKAALNKNYYYVASPSNRNWKWPKSSSFILESGDVSTVFKQGKYRRISTAWSHIILIFLRADPYSPHFSESGK